MRMLIAVALLMMCGAVAQRIAPQSAKQEKAQSDCLDKKGFWIAGCVWTPAKEHLPFDLPAKEWDIQQWDGSSAIVIPHYSCKDVAPDWKQRVLLDSAGGKHHCYAFYLLEQKP